MRKIGAITEENVFALIIAVIGIGLLVFGAVRLFSLYRNAESDDARNALDNIIGKIETLKDGQSNKFFVQGFKGAGNWFLIGWGKGEQGRPDKCFFESCLCVCRGLDEDAKETYQPGGSESYQEAIALAKSAHGSACQSKGFCRDIKAKEINLGQFGLPTTIHGEGRDVCLKTYLQLSENLFEIPVEKTPLGINIIFFGEGYKEENLDIETRYVSIY